MCCLLVISSRFLQAAEPDVDRTKVAALIKQLDADKRSKRQAAETALLKLGPAVLPVLPPAEVVRSVSTRAALQRIRLKLERDKALASIKPTRVSIEGEHSLKETLEQLQQQTGNSIDSSGLAATVLAGQTSIEATTFWRTLDQLAESQGFQVGAATDKASLRLTPNESDQRPPVAYSGPFRIQLTQARFRPVFGNNQIQLLSFRLQLLGEPRLRPLFLSYSPADFSAKLGNKELAVRSRDARLELPLGEGGSGARLKVDFNAKAMSTARECQLQGRCQILLAAGSERLVFTELANASGVARRRGGVTAILQEIRSTKQSIHVRIAISYDRAGPAFESHRTWIFHNRAYMECGESRVDYTDFRNPLQAGKSVVVEYEFPSSKVDLSACRFVYEAPTLLINVPVEFRFDRASINAP
ncbi:MAG: hypothetical protein CMJ78_07140 [Planctomycetaceae bacterium]|nr:hypothetical protein [Planctomycetaceae bacterium]